MHKNHLIENFLVLFLRYPKSRLIIVVKEKSPARMANLELKSIKENTSNEQFRSSSGSGASGSSGGMAAANL